MHTKIVSDLSPGSLEQHIAAYIAGDDGAGDRICRSLEPVIRAEVRRFFPDTDSESDDIAQETLLALLTHLRRVGCSPDRPEAFVTAMAGNRCRNLYRWRKRRPTVDVDSTGDWMAGSEVDPLDALESKEADALIWSALSRLAEPCRQLLLAIYVEQRPMEDLQRESGLESVQGVYYRKYACLKKLGRLLNRSGFNGHEPGGA